MNKLLEKIYIPNHRHRESFLAVSFMA